MTEVDFTGDDPVIRYGYQGIIRVHTKSGDILWIQPDPASSPLSVVIRTPEAVIVTPSSDLDLARELFQEIYGHDIPKDARHEMYQEPNMNEILKRFPDINKEITKAFARYLPDYVKDLSEYGSWDFVRKFVGEGDPWTAAKEALMWGPLHHVESEHLLSSRIIDIYRAVADVPSEIRFRERTLNLLKSIIRFSEHLGLPPDEVARHELSDDDFQWYKSHFGGASLTDLKRFVEEGNVPDLKKAPERRKWAYRFTVPFVGQQINLVIRQPKDTMAWGSTNPDAISMSSFSISVPHLRERVAAHEMVHWLSDRVGYAPGLSEELPMKVERWWASGRTEDPPPELLELLKLNNLTLDQFVEIVLRTSDAFKKLLDIYQTHFARTTTDVGERGDLMMVLGEEG